MQNTDFEKLSKKRGCTNINIFHLDINEVNVGIVFMYSSWSPSIVQLRSLIDSLEKFPDIMLYIYNIDEEEFIGFKKRNLLYSDGWGETFWIKNGKIVADFKKYDSQSIQDLIRNNNSIIE